MNAFFLNFEHVERESCSHGCGPDARVSWRRSWWESDERVFYGGRWYNKETLRGQKGACVISVWRSAVSSNTNSSMPCLSGPGILLLTIVRFAEITSWTCVRSFVLPCGSCVSKSCCTPSQASSVKRTRHRLRVKSVLLPGASAMFVFYIIFSVNIDITHSQFD